MLHHQHDNLAYEVDETGETSRSSIDVPDDRQREKIQSSLLLQMLLHFNFVILPAWIITITYCSYLRYDYLNSIHRVLVIPVIAAVVTIECVRLYFGYAGNLKDKISDIAGFCTVTTLLQLPLQSYLLFSPLTLAAVTERCVQAAMLALLIGQAVLGHRALRHVAYVETWKHRDMWNENVDSVPDKDKTKKHL